MRMAIIIDKGFRANEHSARVNYHRIALALGRSR